MNRSIWMMGTICFVSLLSASATNAFTLNQQNFDSLPAGILEIREGMSGAVISGKAIVVSQKEEGNRFVEWTSNNKELKVKVQPEQLSQATRYKVTVHSSRPLKKPSLIQVRLSFPVEGLKDKVLFWDGYQEKVWNPSEKQLERDALIYTFPVGCVYDQEKGIAVGVTPDWITSTLHSGIIAKGQSAEIFYQTKLVVDAAHPQNVDFIQYNFTPVFGYLDAVQTYYDLFSKWFKPTPGIDSRVYGIGGYIGSCHLARRTQLNAIRRMGLDWEWSYGPWVKSGDWYPEEAEWRTGKDPIRHYEFPGDKIFGPWQKYHDVRVLEFEQGEKTNAMFYYIYNRDVNRELVAKYPDSQMVFKTGNRVESGGPAWPGDPTLGTFACGTGLADRMDREIEKVVKNYRISGFCFDMANLGINDYSPAQLKYGVGRSFDEYGKIYSPDTILQCYFADKIHTLSRDGKVMGVVMNQALTNSVCFPVFHADGVVHEGGAANKTQNIMPVRLMSGQKPFSFWGDWGNGRMCQAVRWAQLEDPEVAKEIQTGYCQHYLFWCLKIGATPHNWSEVPIGKAWMPTLIDLKRAGWNAASGVVSTSNELWIGRFGSGNKTMITITNPKRNTIKADLTVLSRYLGSSAYLFVSDQGQVLQQKVSADKTVFSVELAPKEIMVLRTIAMKQGVPVTVTSQKITDPLSISIDADREIKSNLVVDNLPTFYQGYQMEAMQGSASKILIQYKSSTGVLAKEDQIVTLFNEQDIQNDKAKPCIVVSNNATWSERAGADMLESYFAFCQAYKESPRDEITAQCVKWNEALKMSVMTSSAASWDKSPKIICIGSLDQFPELAKKLRPEENREIAQYSGGFITMLNMGNSKILWLGGKDSSEVEKALKVYFEMMDKHWLGK